MNPTDPLANLKDIHLPDPLSPWPPAIGWWLLAILGIALVAGIIIWLVKRYKKGAFRREALANLALIQHQSANTEDHIKTASQLSSLLKQVAITRHGRNNTAGLSGAAWLKYLDKHGNTHDFTKGDGRILGDDIYKPNTHIDIDRLFKLSQQWIEKQT